MNLLSAEDIEEIKVHLTTVADKLGKAYSDVDVMIIRTGRTEDDAIRSAFFYKWERDK